MTRKVIRKEPRRAWDDGVAHRIRKVVSGVFAKDFVYSRSEA